MVVWGYLEGNWGSARELSRGVAGLSPSPLCFRARECRCFLTGPTPLLNCLVIGSCGRGWMYNR